jgi:hypothetical protein
MKRASTRQVDNRAEYREKLHRLNPELEGMNCGVKSLQRERQAWITMQIESALAGVER